MKCLFVRGQLNAKECPHEVCLVDSFIIHNSLLFYFILFIFYFYLYKEKKNNVVSSVVQHRRTKGHHIDWKNFLVV